MKKPILVLALAVVLVVLLVPVDASALFACIGCEYWMEGLCANTECPQVYRLTTCDVYLAAGCPTLDNLLTAKEQFLQSLEAQAAAEQRLEIHPQPLL